MEDPLPVDSGSSTVKVVGIYGSKFSLGLDSLRCFKHTLTAVSTNPVNILPTDKFITSALV